ncbi:MAG TPA: ABC transporter permease [Candidatus Ozemobacteraceae bacterium]|nr:ABC transporter permease [Candidatus Ozemobacteraceae bacterium]HQG27051.1 ABC transporter permease [Candidatus Ozemobacteraceae bacterium]
MLKKLTIGIAFGIFALYLVLVLSLFAFIDPLRLARALASERVWFSMMLSLKAAVIATLLSMVLAVPSAYALSRYDFAGKRTVDLLLELPLVVTPIALGAMVLIFFQTRVGEFAQTHGVTFVFEFPGIILAQFLTTVGIAVRTMKNTFDAISPRYEMVACTLGATPLRAFLTVTLPMAKTGILAATILTFSKCIGEFGATIMLVGAMPMKTETLPISIFMRVGSADIEGMALMILILVSLGFSVLFVLRFVLTVRYD